MQTLQFWALYNWWSEISVKYNKKKYYFSKNFYLFETTLSQTPCWINAMFANKRCKYTWVCKIWLSERVNILLRDKNTLYKSLLKLSSYCPQVALEKSNLLWIINLKIYSELLKHFWMGSCLSKLITQSAQCCTLVNKPLKYTKYFVN